jgi:glucokinase
MSHTAEEAQRGADGTDVIIGIDIGGTGTRILAMTPERDILSRLTILSPKEFPSETAAEFLRDRIAEVAVGRRPVAIGIGASGPIDLAGTIQNPDTLPGFTGAPLVSGLMDMFQVPVAIDNDAVCAALAEHLVGAGRGAKSLLHVTLGTGIGAAFICDGLPFRGGDGQHPEAGHISVRGETAACYCGRKTCWEQGASRQTLQRIASSVLGRTPSDPAAISDLAAEARGGKSTAKQVFSDYGLRVAEGLGTLVSVYRPQVVVLGGGGAEHFDLYCAPVRDALTKLNGWISDVTVMQTQLDDYGGAIGAALLAQIEAFG